MQIEPNGLLAGNPLTPLASGHPFFRGNVMQGNGIDGLAVVTNRVYFDNAEHQLVTTSARARPIGPQRLRQPGRQRGLGLDRPDLRRSGARSCSGALPVLRQSNGLPTPNTTAFTTEPTPTVTLTIQAALPGTLLADGSTIPSPGQSVIVKLLSDETPNGGRLADAATARPA